jgi:hypothetical protein
MKNKKEISDNIKTGDIFSIINEYDASTSFYQVIKRHGMHTVSIKEIFAQGVVKNSDIATRVIEYTPIKDKFKESESRKVRLIKDCFKIDYGLVGYLMQGDTKRVQY